MLEFMPGSAIVHPHFIQEKHYTERMSYETITCRMSRSDPSIRWGFHARQQGGDIVIAQIESESLADKAGLKTGDIVDQAAGRKVSSVSDVQREIDARSLELNLHLRRFMAHPPTLPWTLSEGSDNKLHLQGFGPDHVIAMTVLITNQDTHNTSAVTATSKSSWQNPAYNNKNTSSRYETTNSSYSKSESSGGNTISAAPIALPPPSSFHSGGGNYNYEHRETSKTESKSTSGPNVNPADNYNVTSRSEWSGNPPPGFDPKAPIALPWAPLPAGPNTFTYQHHESSKTESKSATGPGSNPADNYNVSSSSSWSNTTGQPPANFNPNQPFPSLSTAPFGGPSAGFGTTSGGFGGSGAHHTNPPYSAGAYSGGAGHSPQKRTQFAPDTHYNDQSYIQHGGTGAPSPFQKTRSISPGGNKLLYHAPSSRTRRELSPNASVHHLQYNSPMNLYSSQAAAEQYSQQTGLPVGQVPSSSAPYLSSATRQAIAEEEGGRFGRGMSPSCSPCFKRISNAVGTPVN